MEYKDFNRPLSEITQGTVQSKDVWKWEQSGTIRDVVLFLLAWGFFSLFFSSSEEMGFLKDSQIVKEERHGTVLKKVDGSFNKKSRWHH